MASKVLNDSEQVVYEMIEGFVAANSGIVRLDGFPDIKVVRRKTLTEGQVSVICGACLPPAQDQRHCSHRVGWNGVAALRALTVRRHGARQRVDEVTSDGLGEQVAAVGTSLRSPAWWARVCWRRRCAAACSRRPAWTRCWPPSAPSRGPPAACCAS
jgi:hypothetical protein